MELSRGDFIKDALRLGSGAVMAGILGSLAACDDEREPPLPVLHPTSTPEPAQQPTAIPSPPDTAYLAIAHGQNPESIVQAAIQALGGIERFVKKGNDVIIKPNICVAYYTYEYAATTNPEVVGALVRLCMAAGARRVRVMDQPVRRYSRTGIRAQRHS